MICHGTIDKPAFVFWHHPWIEERAVWWSLRCAWWQWNQKLKRYGWIKKNQWLTLTHILRYYRPGCINVNHSATFSLAILDEGIHLLLKVKWQAKYVRANALYAAIYRSCQLCYLESISTSLLNSATLCLPQRREHSYGEKPYRYPVGRHTGTSLVQRILDGLGWFFWQQICSDICK